MNSRITAPVLTALALTTALTAPGVAATKKVVFTTKMNHWNGYPAYLAYYVTNSKGAYVGTMWLAGSRFRFFEHLRGWMRISGGDFQGVQSNGLSGASVGSGQTLTITFNLPDGVFDAGYVLHIDTASEYLRSVNNDVEVPLTTKGANTPVKGKGYIDTFTYKM